MNTKLVKLVMDLQLFAEKLPEGGTEIPEETESLIIDDDAEVVDETPEGTEDGAEVETTEGEEEASEETEAEETTSEEKQPEDTFNEAQQAKVNDIVAKRLARAEDKVFKTLAREAGVDMDLSNGGQELKEASKLWGFLKLNPNLSNQLQTMINDAVAKGEYVRNTPTEDTSKEQELNLKEARIDLKVSDPAFAKNEQKVMDWAEENEYPITDKKSLEVAYLAWKGANANSEKLAKANKQYIEQRKAQKAQTKQKAKVEGATQTPKTKKVDYTKLSDKEVLSSLGLSLFTEE